jgi:hypothetical protein
MAGMVRLPHLTTLLFAAGIAVHAADQDASVLLAKARAEFLRNRQQESHWVWTSISERSISDKSGKVLERLPSVKVESPIRADGRRCNALLAWGDGVKPYRLDADPEARCEVEQEVYTAFRPDALLASTNVRLRSRSRSAIRLEILPDKTKLDSQDIATRCAASIRATVELDPVTLFPKVMSGEAVESGCDNDNITALTHYGESLNGESSTAPASSAFRKGAKFRLAYELQSGRLGPANDFWICVRKDTTLPLRSGATAMFIWGRKIDLTSRGSGRYTVLDMTTTATEIGADSKVRFGEEAK